MAQHRRCFLLALLVASPSFAVDLAACDVNSEPLVIAHASRTTFLRPLIGPVRHFERVQSLLLTRGGATTSAVTLFDYTCGTARCPPLERFTTGIAATAEQRILAQALNDAKAGTLRDCVIENDLPLPPAPSTQHLGVIEMTWFGRRLGNEPPRRNSFRIVYADPGTTALPVCDPPVDQLGAAVIDFDNALQTHADSRFACSPAGS